MEGVGMESIGRYGGCRYGEYRQVSLKALSTVSLVHTFW